MSECTHPSTHASEEHELPAVEALLAGTLALLTGYSQSLLADLHPQTRMAMGRKIVHQMALLALHPQLSASFRTVLQGLQRRWAEMADCTVEAAPHGPAPDRCARAGPAAAAADTNLAAPQRRLVCPAPRTLQ